MEGREVGGGEGPRNNMSRRDFLKQFLIGSFAVVASSCIPRATATESVPFRQENGEILLSRGLPLTVNRESVQPPPKYPKALQEYAKISASSFDMEGRDYELIYGHGVSFTDVTYLHEFTPDEIPGMGAFIPVLFQIPKELGSLTFQIDPFTIRDYTHKVDINLNPGDYEDFYVAPIVSRNGKNLFTEGDLKPFRVVPNSQGDTEGGLGLALFSVNHGKPEDNTPQRTITLMGVLKDGNQLKLSFDDIPGEYKEGWGLEIE